MRAVRLGEQRAAGIGEVHREQQRHVEGVAAEQVADRQIERAKPHGRQRGHQLGSNVDSPTSQVPMNVWPSPVSPSGFLAE